MTIDSLQRDSQSRISILGSLRYCNYKNKFSISWLSKYANWGRGGYKATVETLSLRRVYSIYSIYISGSPTANNLYICTRMWDTNIIYSYIFINVYSSPKSGLPVSTSFPLSPSPSSSTHPSSSS